MNRSDNTSKRWDSIWNNKIKSLFFYLPVFRPVDIFFRKNIYFKAIDKILEGFSLEDKDIIELGSGTGSNSFYLANSQGAKTVTLVDFSEKGLYRAKEKFCACPVIKIKEDILNFSPKGHYDFVHSTGLVEHFFGRDRFLAIKKHTECAKSGGLIMIWVPVVSSAFRIISFFNRLQGIKEIPFTKEELSSLFNENNLEILREGRTAFGALYGILAKKK